MKFFDVTLNMHVYSTRWNYTTTCSIFKYVTALVWPVTLSRDEVLHFSIL